MVWDGGHRRVETSWVGKVSGEVVTTMITDSDAPSHPVPGKVVALTFDDGPWPDSTAAILQILKDEGVHATFCIIGLHGQLHPELIKAEAAGGHTLCNHTVNHRALPGKPADYVRSQIADNARFIASLVGRPPEIFRAPEGAVDPQVIDTAHSLGMRVLGWTVDPHDFTSPPASVIMQRVLPAVQPGGVVVLHDGGGNRSGTVAALRPIIDALKAQGYTFVTPAPPTA
jgi:peptidoglycan/xylan/chitin deacetylase (PgdA/CDA1 family)